MRNTTIHTIVVLVLAVVCLGPANAAQAKRFSQFIGLGDSTLDTGYFRYHPIGSPAADALVAAAVANGANGGFAGPGIMGASMLAGRFGLNAQTIGTGGANYANGGAFTAPDPDGAGGLFPANVSTVQQIWSYLASVNGVANPNALYMIQSGNNDLIHLQQQTPAWVAAHPTFLQDQTSALVTSVAALQAAGARTIVAPNSFMTAVYAGPGGFTAPANADAYALCQSYNMGRWAGLSAAGVRYIPADLDSVFRFVVQNPALFGFSAYSVLSSSAPSPVSALLTSWLDITPEQLLTFLFVDGKHLTTAGQQIESDYEASLLAAPGQMSLLAEGPVQGGLARMATIQGQIDLSGQQRGSNGLNVWASGGVGSLSFRNDPGFSGSSGAPFAGSVGADYQTPCGLILGGAFTAGTQTQDFTEDGGHFDQTEQAFSLYAAYKAGPVWGNAIGSLGLYQDTIKRQVVLGRYAEQNSADTAGRSLALGLRAGGDIGLGPVTTGPVAGLVLQRVRIDGFTESGPSGVTALSFGAQTRDSLVSQLGWRVFADVGAWRPFAEVKWHHEWADPNRMVKAALTSAVAQPYSMAALPITTDWATVSGGTSFRLNEMTMLKATGSVTVINPNVTSYGGELGVSFSF